MILPAPTGFIGGGGGGRCGAGRRRAVLTVVAVGYRFVRSIVLCEAADFAERSLWGGVPFAPFISETA